MFIYYHHYTLAKCLITNGEHMTRMYKSVIATAAFLIMGNVAYAGTTGSTPGASGLSVTQVPAPTVTCYTFIFFQHAYRNLYGRITNGFYSLQSNYAGIPPGGTPDSSSGSQVGEAFSFTDDASQKAARAAVLVAQAEYIKGPPECPGQHDNSDVPLP
jgi:hypothetical protein